MTKRARVYTRRGHHAHLLPHGTSPSTGAPALCGLAPDAGVSIWYGTAAQSERDFAALLTLCSRCKKAAEVPEADNL